MRIIGDSRVSRQFQVTVPKRIRQLLELDAGDLLLFVEKSGMIVLKRGELQIKTDHDRAMDKATF